MSRKSRKMEAKNQQSLLWRQLANEVCAKSTHLTTSEKLVFQTICNMFRSSADKFKDKSWRIASPNSAGVNVE